LKGGISCADYEAAASFLGVLPKLNEVKDYWPELMRQGSSANLSSHVVHKTDKAAPGFKAAKDRYHLYILLECCL
jgi:glutathionyl-hydroquinone reductase